MGTNAKTSDVSAVSDTIDTDGTISATGVRAVRNYAKGAFIPTWVLLIIMGVAVEFLGRLFGYENNPTQVYQVWISLGTATLSGIIAVIGYFTFMGAKEKQSTLRRRNGVLLMVMGACMLATSFLFKSLMPLLFG
jgi:membrane associated rhomboid family serine protease